MMTPIAAKAPAFPVPTPSAAQGMNLHVYITTNLLAGMLANSFETQNYEPKELAARSIELADILIEEFRQRTDDQPARFSKPANFNTQPSTNHA